MSINYTNITTLSNQIVKLSDDGKCILKEKHGRWIKNIKNLYLFFGREILYFRLSKEMQKNNIIIKNPLSKKFFIIIISCLKNISKINKLRQLWIKDLSNLGINYLFIIGNNNQKKSYIRDDILYVESRDEYEYLPQKIYKSIEYIHQHFDYEYIYKIDDDCILNTLHLFTINTNNSLYIGKKKHIDKSFNRYWHRGKCTNTLLDNKAYPLNRIHIGTFHAKGESGYFLHNSIVPKILLMKKYIYTDLYEDKVIGDVLRIYKQFLIEKPNYRTKLFDKFNDINYKKFTTIVDVPENYLQYVYGKIKE